MSTTLLPPPVAPQPKKQKSLSDRKGNGSGGGNAGYPGDPRRDNPEPDPERWATPLGAYRTASWFAVFSIMSVFATLTHVLESRWVHSKDWVSVALPHILYVNTAVLLVEQPDHRACARGGSPAERGPLRPLAARDSPARSRIRGRPARGMAGTRFAGTLRRVQPRQLFLLFPHRRRMGCTCLWGFWRWRESCCSQGGWLARIARKRRSARCPSTGTSWTASGSTCSCSCLQPSSVSGKLVSRAALNLHCGHRLLQPAQQRVHISFPLHRSEIVPRIALPSEIATGGRTASATMTSGTMPP